MGKNIIEMIFLKSGRMKTVIILSKYVFGLNETFFAGYRKEGNTFQPAWYLCDNMREYGDSESSLEGYDDGDDDDDYDDDDEGGRRRRMMKIIKATLKGDCLTKN